MMTDENEIEKHKMKEKNIKMVKKKERCQENNTLAKQFITLFMTAMCKFGI